MTLGRRKLLLRGRATGAGPRLPWLDMRRFAQRCTACEACAEVCPEGIVSAGEGGLPAIDFSHGGCTFCGRCADACPEELFTSRAEAAWPDRVTIGDACLTSQGIVCQSCRDVCESRAITFELRPGIVASPMLDAARCTACGACTGVCPVDAIVWSRDAKARARPEARVEAHSDAL